MAEYLGSVKDLMTARAFEAVVNRPPRLPRRVTSPKAAFSHILGRQLRHDQNTVRKPILIARITSKELRPA